MASINIHLSPALLVWTMRWNQEVFHAKFPGVFGIPNITWYRIH